ncbi:hypothetical protein [Nocardia sp. NPDC056000]|uniref:hypothetical protein n=1 Tax=Nocardia sp. NPDC056000 TaxID=3345674 RepID=UPI0035D644F3
MAKVSVRLPDDVEAAIKAQSGGNFSAWVTKACEDALTRAAVRVEMAAERKNPDAFTSHDERESEMEQFR